MKVYIINPDYGMSRELMNKELSILSNYVSDEVQLNMDCLTKTVVEINTLEDAIKATPEVFEMAKAAEKAGYDAIILYCFSDPGYELCQKALSIPVYGGARSSIKYATHHFQGKIGVVLTNINREAEKREFITKLGFDDTRFIFDAVNVSDMSCWVNRELVTERLLQVCQKLSKQGVSCIILGCTAFLGLGEVLTQGTYIPVIDPAVCALKDAEQII